MDHMFQNCQIYKERLSNEKETINQRNAEKYDVRRDTTAKGQEGEFKMHKVKNTRSEEPQSKGRKQEKTSDNVAGIGKATMGGSGEQPPRKPNKGRDLPPDKPIEDNEEEEEMEQNSKQLLKLPVLGEFRLYERMDLN